MTPEGFIITAVLLGLFVAVGGAYGLLYAAGRLRSSTLLARAAWGCYLLQLVVALAVCVGSSLGWPWKLFLAASAAVYGFIPPLMWRLLDVMHGTGREMRFP